MTTEPTLNSTGLGEPKPTSPGWYPDPDPEYGDGYARYWDGGAWQPPWGRRPPVKPPSPLKVGRWYWLACMLPFALAVFAPFPVGEARAYRLPSDYDDTLGAILDHPAMIAAGWALFAVGLLGVLVGTAVFQGQRDNGDKAALRWNAGAWSVAVVVGLFGLLGTALMNADYAPPRGADVESADMPIGAVVQSTPGSGSFSVEVVSIKCDWFGCSVSTRVTNTGTETAEFPCGGTEAITSDGEVVSDAWVTLGNAGLGCEPPNLQPGETASVPIALQDVHDRKLVTLIVPGADEQIDLPEVNR